MRTVVKTLPAVCALLGLAALETGFAGTTVILAERAFTGQEIVENVCIVIEDDRIRDIVPMKDFTPIGGSLVIDAAGTTVCPGFIDSHVHILSMPIRYLQNVPRYGWGRIAEEMNSQVPRNRRELLESGITTVFDMGAPVDSVARMGRDLAAGKILGPDLYYGGPLFTAPGGHPAGTIYRGQHSLIDTATVQVSERGPALEKVAELQSKGARFIKLVYDDGVFYGGTVPRLDLALAGEIADAAHAKGLRVIAHVGAAESCFADMIGIGVDGVEHCFAFNGSDAVFREMASRGISFTPTLSIYELYAPEAMPRMQESVRRAFSQGVSIAAGTDFPSTRFMSASEGYFRELALLEEAGLPRIDVLRAATEQAARKLGKEGEVGSLAPGRTANIVLLDGDIMDGALRRDRVRTVMLHGKVVFEDRKLVDGLRNGFRRSSFVISPYGFFDPLAGFSVGLSVLDFNLANTGVAVSLNAAYSFDNYFGAELSVSPPSPIPSTSLGATVHFDDYPRRFFGLSNDSILEDALVYGTDRHPGFPIDRDDARKDTRVLHAVLGRLPGNRGVGRTAGPRGHRGCRRHRDDGRDADRARHPGRTGCSLVRGLRGGFDRHLASVHRQRLFLRDARGGPPLLPFRGPRACRCRTTSLPTVLRNPPLLLPAGLRWLRGRQRIPAWEVHRGHRADGTARVPVPDLGDHRGCAVHGCRPGSRRVPGVRPERLPPHRRYRNQVRVLADLDTRLRCRIQRRAPVGRGVLHRVSIQQRILTGEQMMKTGRTVIIRAFAFPLIILAIVMVVAGRVSYWQEWGYGASNVLSLVANLAVLRKRPDLVEERLGPGEGTKRWDKVYFISLAFAALDIGRFSWEPALPPWAYLLSCALFAVGQGIHLGAKGTNRWFATVVRIQKDRGQEVCDSGPYRFVRHPGYVGGILFMIATPLLLGSLLAVIPQGIAVAFLVVRTYREDKTLQKELPGYAE